MKHLAKLCIIFVLSVVSMSTFAYTATEEDKTLLQGIEKKIDTMFPVKVHKLERIYHKLARHIRFFEIKKESRIVYILKKIQKLLRDKIFIQDEVCIANYAQLGDTVEIKYTVVDKEGEELRNSDKLLSFNPGTPALWKELSYGVFGTKSGERKFIKVASLPVKPGENKNFELIKDRKAIEQFTKETKVGDIIFFGSTKVEGVVTAKITALDDELVTFDFSLSGPGHPLYITLHTEKVNKFCRKQI